MKKIFSILLLWLGITLGFAQTLITQDNTDGVTGSGSKAQISQYTAKGISITWDANDSKYAFDGQEITKLPKDQYPSVKNADGTAVLVPYKAVVNGKDDIITAKITITNQEILKDAKIEFKVLSSGKNIEAVQSGNDYKLKLKGAYDYAEEEIVAALVPNDKEKKQQIISSFRLVHLSPKDINVSFVPLDKEAQNKLDDYGNKVNSTYLKVGINFNVRKEDIPKGFYELGIGDKIESGDPKLMSTYGSDQLKINSLYKGTDQRYVMFVTSKQASTGADGYFRLNGQFGYVFGKAKNKTAAHELGHGVFKLEHPWEAYGTTQGATPLLMDYSQGEILSHLDWKQINDPKFKIYAFQGQSEGELAGGFGLAPDFGFIKANTSTALHGVVKVGEGFLSGFIENNVQYQWIDAKKGYYPNGETTKEVYASKEVPTSNSIVWLIYEHDAVCGKSKYIKTTYADVESNIINKKDKISALEAYIKKYKDITDNTQTIYSGYIPCNNSTSSGNGDNGDIINHTNRYKDEIQKMLNSLNLTKSDTGIKGKIYITESKDTQYVKEAKEALEALDKSDKNEIYIWANYTGEKDFELNIAVGNGVKNKAQLSEIQKVLKDHRMEIMGMKLAGDFNPLTAMLDGMAQMVSWLNVPEKFYNPAVKDYNPVPAEVFAWMSGDKLMEIPLEGKMDKTYTPSRIHFAFVCGVWNGLVGTVEAIPSGASMLLKANIKVNRAFIDIATNKDGTRDKLISSLKTISELDKEKIKTLADGLGENIGNEVGKMWDKYTDNACMISYSTGQAGFVVLSMAIGAGEANAAKSVLQAIDKLDVIGQMMGKAFSLAGKIAKPMLNKAGKGFVYVFEKSFKIAETCELKFNTGKLYAGLPFPELRKKVEKLTEADISKLPADENGIRIANVDEQAIPIGPEEQINKLKKATNSFLESINPAVLEKLKNTPGFDKVLEDMATQWTKFKGGKFVLDYCNNKGDDFIKAIKEFETPIELDLGDGVTKLRKYDIEMQNGSVLEFKDWSAWASWSNSSFRKQFIPDLADINFTALGQKRYIFKANNNINATTLKEYVLNSLKKADGTPIEEVKKLFEDTEKVNKFKKMFDDNRITKAQDLLKKLEDDKVFNQIFEIAE